MNSVYSVLLLAICTATLLTIFQVVILKQYGISMLRLALGVFDAQLMRLGFCLANCIVGVLSVLLYHAQAWFWLYPSGLSK